MAISLNHTIVLTKDKWAAGNFLADMVESEAKAFGPFIRVLTGETEIEFQNIEDNVANDRIPTTHLAFLMSEDELDVVLEKLQRHGVQPYQDPFYDEPGVNHLYGGRGCYIHDPVDGHQWEFITAPYSGKPAHQAKGKWKDFVDPTAVDA
ncbi:VOC family protein [Streptomyces griseorubiginosus]|uniref:VOC family protein n=1 Tax=Streptomyces griseorubiginosus TaxID=67304 RepID=UPI0036E38472